MKLVVAVKSIDSRGVIDESTLREAEVATAGDAGRFIARCLRSAGPGDAFDVTVEVRGRAVLWLVEEKCSYTVEATSKEEAEELFLEHGPEVSVESPVSFLGADERTIKPAATYEGGEQ